MESKRRIPGDAGNDVIYGDGGDDILLCGTGDDIICKSEVGKGAEF